MISIIFYILLIIYLLTIVFSAALTIFSFIYLFIEHKTNSDLNNNWPIKKWYQKCFKECLLNINKFILFPLRFIPTKYPKNISKNSNTGIILIHGYNRSKTDWLWFQKKLQPKTNLPIFTININKQFAPLQVLAGLLQKKILDLSNNFQIKNWILISHSLGGVITSFMIENLFKDNILAVITIGSPLAGTKLAFASLGKNIKQIQPNCPFINNLQKNITKSKTKYFNIATTIDNLIIPWQSAILKNAIQTMVVHDATHQELIYSTPVINKIALWLNDINS